LAAWTLAVVINLGFYGFCLAPGVLGGIVAIAVTLPLTERQLKGVEKNGEWKSTRRSTVLAIIGVTVFVTVVSAVFYLIIVGSNLALMHQSYSFLGIFLISVYGCTTALYLSWERKHKKRIFIEGFWRGRIFALEIAPLLPPPLPPPPPPPDL